MKSLVTFAWAAFLGACGAIPENGTTGEQSTSITCSQIDDQTYSSVVDHDIGQQCGTNSAGVYLCTPYSGVWMISFQSSDHTYYWAQGNDGETGTYACSKAALNLNDSNADNIQNIVQDTSIFIKYVNGTKSDTYPLQSREHQYNLDQ